MDVQTGEALPSFAGFAAGEVANRSQEHGGVGPIAFRRLFDHSDFQSPIDFVDVTIVYPGSTIGRHEHAGTEEIYLVIAGNPLIEVSGERRRLSRGDAAVVRSGQWHQLTNDTETDVMIGVVQVRGPGG